jgi:uncharacterized membrane protein YphA (DoxX/SURF4 family)
LFEPPGHHNLFMKNVAILGGLLTLILILILILILFVVVVGPGRYSIDCRIG